ncbi:MAG: TRAP transporter substrate-binding protein [Desulfarculus sp.]|nr:TRAP transporter substrate-binding protein [Desulfarculus sp.]
MTPLPISIGPPADNPPTPRISHGHTLLATQWAEEVEKRTDGAVKINIFPGATLTPADQSYDGVVKGISDLAMGVLSYVKGRFPLCEVIDLPLGYQSGLEATRLSNAFHQKFQPKELSDTKVMYLHGHGPGILHTKTQLSNLEELKGLKIRCTGTSAKIVKALGATPVAMPQTETYDALQKGLVQGTLTPIEGLKGWKFAEVLASTTKNLGSSYSVAFFVVMNKKKWDALPQQAQAAIEQVNREWMDKTGQAWDQFDQAGQEFTLAKGNKVIELTPAEDQRWAKLVQPILDEYVAASQAKGLPGREALEFCQQWLKNNR